MRSYTVCSTSTESVPIEVEAPADPTGGAVSFAFTKATDSAAPSTFTAGSWDTAYDADENTATALTPTLPSSGSGVELAVGRWKVYTRRIVGGETVTDVTGILEVAP